LPIIIPVVIYHGTGKWKFGLDFADYFNLPTEAFRKYVPKFEHILHDITHMGDEAFKTSTIMEIFHLLFKYIHYPEFDEKIQSIYDLLEKLPEDDIKEYLKIIVKYVLSVGPIPVERVAEYTKRFSGGEVMTGVAFEQIKKEVEQEYLGKKAKWESEAEQKGELKKSRDLLLKNINARFGLISPDLVNRIKSIQSIEVMDSLFDQSLRAESFEDFKEQVLRATEN
jgi:hypothetical protein